MVIEQKNAARPRSGNHINIVLRDVTFQENWALQMSMSIFDRPVLFHVLSLDLNTWKCLDILNLHEYYKWMFTFVKVLTWEWMDPKWRVLPCYTNLISQRMESGFIEIITSTLRVSNIIFPRIHCYSCICFDINLGSD